MIQERKFTSEIPQQQQPRKRSYRPWGCYLRPGSPSSQRQIRLSAAFRLRRRDFLSRKPDFSQNKKHIARKLYVVLSFHGDILSHHVFTKQGVLTKLNTFLRCYPAYKSKQLNVSELARVCDISRTTAYKYIGLLEA